MTAIQRVAQVFGWIFVVIAIWGALLTGTSMNADLATAPRLWGLFPVNFAHNLVHLLFGLWGIAASRSAAGARIYTIWAGVIYLVLAVLGLFVPEGFGLVPIGGNDIWLHLVLGVLLLAAGLTLTSASDPLVEPAPTRTVMPPTTASSPEGTVTRPPVHPTEPEGHAEPVDPERAGSSGAAEGAPPPRPPENVVDEPPRQPDDEDAGDHDADRPR